MPPIDRQCLSGGGNAHSRSEASRAVPVVGVHHFRALAVVGAVSHDRGDRRRSSRRDRPAAAGCNRGGVESGAHREDPDGRDRHLLAATRSPNSGPAFTRSASACPGFNTVRREGLELNTGFTATINADLRPGGVEETITVTGSSPVVDITNVRSQNVLTREILDALPTSKSVQALAAVTLGALTTGALGGGEAGGSKGEPVFGFAQIHGSLNGIRTLDGMKLSSAYNVSLASAQPVQPDDGAGNRDGDERRLRGNGEQRPQLQHGAQGRWQPVSRQLQPRGDQRQLPVE